MNRNQGKTLVVLALGVVIGLLSARFFNQPAQGEDQDQPSEPKTVHKPPTKFTREINGKFKQMLPFKATQAFKDATKNFIAPLPNGGLVKNTEGRVVWDLPQFDFLKGDKAAPDTVNPSLWRQAQLMYRNAGLFKVTDGIYQVRGLDLSNISFIEGNDGLIVMDPLISNECAKAALELYYKHRPRKPVVAVIHSHSHLDHYGGVAGVVDEDDVKVGKVQIIAPEGYTEAALNESVIGGNRQSRLSAYQYSMLVERGPKGNMTSGLGLDTSKGTVSFMVPTDLISKTGQKMTIAGLEFDFMMAPDTEAPAEMFFYIPKYKALCTAEDSVHNLHNVYSLRGAKVRSAYNWAMYLKEARRKWGGEAEVLYAPHHWPIWGADRIDDFLKKQSAAYKYINDQTVRLANMGYDMTEAAEMIELPEALSQEWYLRGYYGTVNHNVKAAFDKNFGWYNGNPSTLHPLPRLPAAEKYVEYMGGSEAILKKAKADYANGEYRWVAQVLMHVVYAAPKNMAARNLLADTYEQLAYQSEAGTWRGWYLSGAKDLREGVKRLPILAFASPDTVRAMPLDLFFDYLGVRLNGPKAAGQVITLNFNFPDTEEKYLLAVEYGTLQYYKGEQAKKANATVTMKRATLNDLIMKKTTLVKAITAGDVKIQGDAKSLQEFLNLLDTFDPWYNVITPVVAQKK
jgi:alkyl sulfatase BDS1-like metallo-beta-lactamase superfamily hydrolase